MSRHLLVIAVTLFAVGCSDPRDPKRKSIARINDVAVPATQDSSGYRVVAVDAATPLRASGSVITAVPFVFVEPGKHTFTVKPRDGSGKETSFTATVAADRQYRIGNTTSGTFTLVEETR